MQKFRVEITRTAELDIQEIFEYVYQNHPSAGMALVKSVERQINSLERYPLRCALIPETEELGKQYRHIVYGSYRTIFQVEGLKVTILRVVHGARLLDFGMLDS